MALVQVGSSPSDCQGLRNTARGRASRKGRSSFCAQSASFVHRLSGTASKPQVTPPLSSEQIGVSLPFLARPLIGCALHPSSSSDDQRHFKSLFRESSYSLFIADVTIVAVVGILVAILIVAPMNKVSAHRIRCRHSQHTCFVQIVINHRSAGSTSGRDGHRRRLSRPVHSPSPGVCSVSGADT